MSVAMKQRKGVVRGAHDGLAPDVEAGVHDHGTAGPLVEPLHQAVEAAVPLASTVCTRAE
jgi:hypothetical protein